MIRTIVGITSIFILGICSASTVSNDQFSRDPAHGQVSASSSNVQNYELQKQQSMAVQKQENIASLKQEKEQFSELAFGNASNVSNDENDSNVNLKVDKNFGTVGRREVPVFGSNLFSKQCSNLVQTRFSNPKHRLSVGDQVNIVMWGAFQFQQVLTVDTQGNVFLPEAGPVKLLGVENKQLNTVLKTHLGRVFKKDVHIYGDLITAQPVQVYVSGFVSSPGLYDGLSSDSVIYFLCRAGGINLKEGSFRNIELVRDGKNIQSIDLYHFLLAGDIGDLQLQQGDTIVVGHLENTVTAEGNVRNPYQYEMAAKSMSMRDLSRLAGVDKSVTHVRIEHHQGRRPMLNYLPITTVENMRAKAGDYFVFTSDQDVSQVVVTLSGAVQGQHQFIMPTGSNLDTLMRKLHFSEDADINNLQLYRESVALQQKAAIESSMSRLQRQLLTTQPVTADGAKMQGYQAEMMMKFVEQTKMVKFKGQVVLGEQSQWRHVILQNNDEINLPKRTVVVTVSGDVLNSISIEAESGYGYMDYINAAGGFADTADKKKALLVHQNGRIEILNHQLLSKRKKIDGGDQIIVLPKPPSENWQVAQVMTTILYQLAVSAGVALRFV